MDRYGVAGETMVSGLRTLGSDICHMYFRTALTWHLIWGDGLHPLEDHLQLLNDYHRRLSGTGDQLDVDTDGS